MFLFANVSLFGQKVNAADVPTDVTQSLEFEHPAAKVSGWTIEDNNFVAAFKEDGMTGKAYFANDGNWVKSVFPVPKGQLPSAITDYLKKAYEFPNITVSALQSTPKERMHYYLEVKADGMGQEFARLTFSDMGVLISREDPERFIEQTKKEEPAKEVVEKAPAKEKPTTAPKEKPEPDDDNEVAEEVPVKENKKKQVAVVSSEPDDDEVAEEAPVKENKKKQVAVISYESESEALSSSEVSTVLIKALAKKAQNPAELNWYKIDSFYVAKCFYREQKHDLFFREDGTWVNTYFTAGEIAVTSVMQKHLNSFFSGWRFKAVVKESRADKQDKTLVEIYEKDNFKNKLVTTVVFDKAGKFIRSFDPEQDTDTKNNAKEVGLDKYYEKISVGADDEATDGIPAHVVNVFTTKYPRITNPQWEIDDEGNYMAVYMGAKGKEVCVIGQSGTIMETQIIGNPEFLSSTIQGYIKKYAKGFKVDEYYAVKNLLEKQNYYKVNISNKKTNEKITLWFTAAGKVVQR